MSRYLPDQYESLADEARKDHQRRQIAEHNKKVKIMSAERRYAEGHDMAHHGEGKPYGDKA